VPIIGITGNVLSEDRDFFIKHGANQVIHKPFSVQSLERVLREITVIGDSKGVSLSAPNTARSGQKESMTSMPVKT
jgi:CheY-like chemotaxis protein